MKATFNRLNNVIKENWNAEFTCDGIYFLIAIMIVIPLTCGIILPIIW